MQQHPWNQQRQQQQQQQQQQSQQLQQTSRNASSYTNQPQQSTQQNGPNSQRSPPHQQSSNQLGYHHQPLQTVSAHHNSANSAAAYYQQAHVYPTYQAQAHSQDQHQQQQNHQSQQQQQQAGHGQQASSVSENQHGQHHHGANVPATVSSSSVLNASVVGSHQQHSSSVHHQPNPANTQSSTLNPQGWSPSLGSLAPQAHHAVVTDPSTMAYMAHAYQSHGNSVTDHHHRNSNGPLSSQQNITSGPQASSYTLDSMYNAPVAAAAAAAYNYNNYNAAAFFQTSNNNPHTQTGHPSAANLSAFWNHNQPTQPRTAHSQTVPNQSSVQQRQPLVSEQTANYMHDPRMFYGRPTYGQGMQNFGQHHSQSQPQNDVLHHRVTGLAQQQHQLLQHHESQLHPVSQNQHSQLHHPSSIVGQPHHTTTSTMAPSQNLLNHQQIQPPLHHNQVGSQPQVNNLVSSGQVGPINKPFSGSKNTLHLQKSSGTESDSVVSKKSQLEFDQNSSNAASQISNSSPGSGVFNSTSNSTSITSVSIKDTVNKPDQTTKPPSPGDKTVNPQTVIKNDFSTQYLRKNQDSLSQQMSHGRGNIYRNQQPDDRGLKQQSMTEAHKKSSGIGSERVNNVEAENKMMQQNTNQQSNKPPSNVGSTTSPIEESMASMAVTVKKPTTWASIASQPAKVSQPKSLKSKMAASNSVLSSAKHLAVVSIDSSSNDSKNAVINAPIKNVPTATTSVQRSNIAPSLAKLPGVSNIKLDLLGDQDSEKSRISWPVVNAAIDLSANDPPLKESFNNQHNEKQQRLNNIKESDGYNTNQRGGRDYNRDSIYNQSQGNSKMVNQHYNHNNQDVSVRDQGPWSRRGNDYRERKNFDRREPDGDKMMNDFDREEDNMRLRQDNLMNNNSRAPNQQGNGGRLMDRPRPSRGDNYSSAPRFGGNNKYERHNSHPDENHHHSYDRSTTGGEPISNNNNVSSKLDMNNIDPSKFNPKTFNLEPENARFFIIKSYSGEDIHKSIKYSIWCSTDQGNRKLDEAYRQQQAQHPGKEAPIYLFFSINGSGHFCGMAQMTSSVDFNSSSGVWAQSKWQGEFSVKWIYVKNVNNKALRHITLENNEGKPVTNSRDTQEVPSEKGKAVLKIIHQYQHTNSLFDDFVHYDRRSEEDKFNKQSNGNHVPSQQQSDQSRHNQQQHQDNRHHRGGAGGLSDRPGIGGGSSRFGSRPFVNHNSNNGGRDYQGNRGGARFGSHHRLNNQGNNIMDNNNGKPPQGTYRQGNAGSEGGRGGEGAGIKITQ